MPISKIEWTHSTWNPVTGCSKVSPGCLNCYAEVMTRRLKAMGIKKYQAGFDKVVWHDAELGRPRLWIKPRAIFVCSMSDLFHECVLYEFIDRVYETIFETERHTYFILTKRAEQMFDYISRNAWLSNVPPKNVRLGVTVESPEHLSRLEVLREIPAAVKFVSLEPLLASVLLGQHLEWLDWVIVGCESGARRRECEYAWMKDIVRQCRATGVPVFVKQIELHGKVSREPNDDWPPELRVREWPEVR